MRIYIDKQYFILKWIYDVDRSLQTSIFRRDCIDRKAEVTSYRIVRNIIQQSCQMPEM